MTRKDLFGLSIDEIEIETDFNIRYDMGNLQELSDSIVENGIDIPISVFQKKGSSKYTPTDGHRRYFATKMAMEQGRLDKNIFKIPAMKARPQSIEQRTLHLITKNMGKPLTMLEETMVYERLLNYGMSEADIATKSSKSTTHISNCMSLMTAGIGLRNMIKEGQVSATQVVSMLKENDAFTVEKKLKGVLRRKLNEFKTKEAKKHVADDHKVAAPEVSNVQMVSHELIHPHTSIEGQNEPELVVDNSGTLMPQSNNPRIIKITAKDINRKPKPVIFSIEDMKKAYEEGQMSVRILKEGEKYEPKTFEQYMHSLKLKSAKVRKRIPIKSDHNKYHPLKKAN